MKNLLTLLAVMLFVVSAYAGIIYDNTTDDISSSSGTMTIDGSPFADGFTDPTATNTWTADQSYDDNVNITLGTGGDVDIDFNSTTGNLTINPQVVGTGHLVIKEATVGNGTIGSATLNLDSTDAGNLGIRFIMYHDSSSPADNDEAGLFSYYSNDSGAAPRAIGHVIGRFTDVTATEMDSELRFCVMNAVNSANCNTIGRLINTGVWTDSSGAASKEYEGQVQDIYGERILGKLDNLFVSRYHTKGVPDNQPTTRHISPTAEDLWDMFGVGQDPRVLDQDTDGDGVMDTPTPGIAAKDLAGIALAAIQELHQRVKAVEAELSTRGPIYLPPQANPGPQHIRKLMARRRGAWN